ncbi:low molecular weight phosphatase family protein [Microbacterium sp. ET2]|uniref:arsenate reductase/protein-tyrosine-phosphatase family protein n=1 Tax=Microbacterium albipurpureum TaxID=3050384 RepID=UPI00259C8933|nr:low molecular weight phosphatase family protein [Microbacterium sp. ET2 (Ac-2212)]WJL94759.1 low molecular weight phosphatase family protein [Microbacterium sp. ET2 (Ac-2212)]
MFEILTVCTGNICRSPLAAALLQTRLAPLDVLVASAGTRGLREAPMTEETVALATALGVSSADIARHRSRFLMESHLAGPDLILAMTREHRREVVELAPSRMRSTFTIREFGRLADSLTDHQLRSAAQAGGADASSRVRSVTAAVASQRGLVLPPADPADDDIIDPYGRSWRTYELSASQLEPAVTSTVRALKLAF